MKQLLITVLLLKATFASAVPLIFCDTTTNYNVVGHYYADANHIYDMCTVPRLNSANDRKPPCPCRPCTPGMPVWSISEPYINLWVQDTPVFYTTTLGTRIDFTFTYKQRDTSEQNGTPYMQTVPVNGWHHNFESYVHFVGKNCPGDCTPYTASYQHFDNWTATIHDANAEYAGYSDAGMGDGASHSSLYSRDGDPYHIYPATGAPGQFPYVPEGGTNSALTGFRRFFKDGSQYVYGLIQPTLVHGANDTVEGNALLTEIIDTNGNTTRLAYTNHSSTYYLLSTITDSEGQVTSLQYTNTTSYQLIVVAMSACSDTGCVVTLVTNVVIFNAQQVSAITMPGSRTVSIAYNNQGRISSITDAIGMPSFFDYDAAERINAITTPYGTTYFDHIDSTAFGYYPGNGTTNEPPGTYHVGSGGGEGRVNRAITVTHPDFSKELYMYRFDAPLLNVFIPTAPDETVVFDSGSIGDYMGAPTRRNSYHWDRQQYALLSTNNLDALADNDFNLATTSHWLYSSEVQYEPVYDQLVAGVQDVSGLVSWRRTGSPGDGMPGTFTMYDYDVKNWEYTTLSETPSRTTAYTLLPDYTYKMTSSSVDSFGRPSAYAESYTKDDGTIGTRSKSWQYLADYITISYTQNGIPFRSYIADISMLSGITEFDGGTTSISGLQYGYITNKIINGLACVLTIPMRLNYDVVDSEYNTSTYWFNTTGQITGHKSAQGLTTTNLYNATGLYNSRLIEVSITNGFSFTNGLLASFTNQYGVGIQFGYDKLSRRTIAAFPDGTTISNTYSRLDLSQTKDRLGNVSSFSYDWMRNLTAFTDANFNSTTLTYCYCGGINTIIDALGGTTTFARDNVGQVKTITRGPYIQTLQRNTVSQVTNAYDNLGSTLLYNYNNQGLVTSVTRNNLLIGQVKFDIKDRPGVVIGTDLSFTNSFDTLDHLTSQNTSDGRSMSQTFSQNLLSSSTDAAGKLSTYGYDPAGRLASYTNALQQIAWLTYGFHYVKLTDGNSNTTTWFLDTYGRTIGETNANGVLVKTNGYNANGWVTSFWTKRGITASVGYDGIGQVTSVKYPGFFTNSYGYDSVNNLISMTDTNGTTAFGWQSLGANKYLLQTEDGPWTSDTVSNSYLKGLIQTVSLSQPSGSWNQSYTYDASVFLKTVQSPAGLFTLDYTNNKISGITLPAGNLASSKIKRTFDGSGRLNSTTLRDPLQNIIDSSSYLFDANNLITNLTRAKGSQVVYTYDDTGELITALGYETNGTARLNESFGYGYDAAQNLVARTNGVLTQAFKVDKLNQLTNVTRSTSLTVAGSLTARPTTMTVNGKAISIYGDMSYATATGVPLVDGVNNFTNLVTYAGGNSSNVTVLTLPVQANLVYDADENLISDGLHGYTYNADESLATITVTNGWRSEFIYDGLMRRRVRKEYTWQSSAWTLTNEVHYIYDGINVLQERDGSNTPQVTYTYAYGLRARTTSTDTAFYQKEALGSTTALVNRNGTVLARYTYDPFGNVLAKSGPLADVNLYRYAGQEVHPNSGLIHHQFRYFDPNLQRWLNRDPIGELGGLNLYDYAGNDPINRIDPLGLWGIAFGNNSGSSYFNIGWGNPSLYFSPSSVNDIGQIPQGDRDIGRFLTGIGDRDRNYGPEDQITQDLKNSPGIQQARSSAVAELNSSGGCSQTSPEDSTPFGYSLKGAGYDKAATDLLNMILMTSDANTASIGSYNGNFSLENIDPLQRTATIVFHVDNNMGLGSATRSPTSGNSWLPNNPLSFGPLSTVHQTFDWTETISY